MSISSFDLESCWSSRQSEHQVANSNVIKIFKLSNLIMLYCNSAALYALLLLKAFCEQNTWNKTVGLSSLDSPAGNYMFKVDNRNSRTRCEICSKLTIKLSGVTRPMASFCYLHWHDIDNFEHISHLVLVFLSLTLSR